MYPLPQNDWVLGKSGLNEIEFEREGEIEIKFVPIRPGKYEFEIEGLQSKGMVGEFIVK